MEVMKETKFGAKVAYGMMMLPEYTRRAEKGCDTILHDENAQHNTIL